MKISLKFFVPFIIFIVSISLSNKDLDNSRLEFNKAEEIHLTITEAHEHINVILDMEIE
jgi:hypothetical protein